MNLLESLFSDLVLMLMQQPLLRWGIALAASLWVWLIGDEDARFRPFYLMAPFLVAGFIEFSDIVLGGGSTGQGGKLSQYLIVVEGARKVISPIGLGAVVLAVILGLMRGIGFAIGVAVLLCAYFVRGGGQGGEGLRSLSTEAVTQGLMLLPTILVVLLTAYGLGASFRRLREYRRDDYR
jgi:hypothetical protein